MSGLFEHLAAFDEGDRTARRQAAAVANKRVQDRFGSFLGASRSTQEFAARMSVVSSDLEAAVREACAEFGVDHTPILASLSFRLAGDPTGDPSNPANAEAAQNLADKNQRKDEQRNPMFEVAPATEEHCTALGNCGAEYIRQGTPLYTVLKNGQPHAMFDERGQTIGKNNAPADDISQQLAAPYQATASHEEQPRGLNGQWHEGDIDGELATAPSAVGEDAGLGTLASFRVSIAPAPSVPPAPGAGPAPEAYAPGGCPNCKQPGCQGVCNVNGPANGTFAPVTATDSTGLGEAVKPKIDKGTQGDAKGHNKSEVPDTGDAGSPWPTERQSIEDGRVDGKAFEDGHTSEAPKSDLKHEDPSSHSPKLKTESLPSEKENAGFQTGGEDEGDKTKTFPKGDQANPVTSALDPDKNPIADIMSEWVDDSIVEGLGE